MSTTDTVFCEQCGATIEPSAQFCTQCGSEQAGTAPAEPAGAAPEATPAPAPAWLPPGAGAPGPAAGPSWPPPGAGQNLPVFGGLPLELWLVIAAFAIPGGWIMFEFVKALPDAIKAWGANFFGFRLGLALTMILVLVGLLGLAMLGIAWKLYQRDRVGRGLAYAFAATIIVSVLFSSERTSSQTWALVLSIAGIAILAFAPRVRAIFDRATSPDGAPTSVVVSRTLIAVFCALAILVAVIYLLIASVSAKYVIAALVAVGAALGASQLSKRLSTADRTARQHLSIGGAAVAILLIALGRSTTGLLFPLGVIVSAIGCLWIPNDARAFFGDQPLKVSAS